MLNRFAILSVAALSLAACAYTTKTYAPDGSEAYTINCSGAALGWDVCYKKAGDICGKAGYEEVRKDGEQQATIGATQWGLAGQQSANRSMMIRCKT